LSLKNNSGDGSIKLNIMDNGINQLYRVYKLNTEFLQVHWQAHQLFFKKLIISMVNGHNNPSRFD
jgi:hypothetical protein